MENILQRFKIDTKITYIILGANAVIWIATMIAGGSTNPNVLIRFGALNKHLVFNGEVWRLISAAFLHIGPLHLLINSYTLFQLGIFIENFFGQRKLIATYVLTAITGGILSILFNDTVLSAGASGALFGLTGLILGNAWAKKTYVMDLPIDERSLIPFVIFNLFIGFTTPGIDNWAHIGGLLGGVALGFVFDPAMSFDPSKLKRILPEILAKLSLGLLFISGIFWLLSIWGINILSNLNL